MHSSSTNLTASPIHPAQHDSAQLCFHLATTAAERDAIYRLRYEVYALENGFRAPGTADHRAWEDASDAQATHLYATAGGKLMGALRIVYGADAAFPEEIRRAYDLARFQPSVPPEKMAITSRFALQRAHRAGPAALQFFVESARQQHARGVALSLGDSHLNLLPFYTALGFRTYAAPYHHPVAGTLVPFVLITSDVEHLRKVGSPLLALADASSHPFAEPAPPKQDFFFGRAPLRGARSDAMRFWEDLYAALGPPPFEQGPLAGLGVSELRSLLGLSYLVDWPGESVLLRSGHPVTERWLLLSGQVEVEGAPLPPLSIVGGAAQDGDARHEVDARVGPSGALLLSLDERKLRQTLSASGRVTDQLRTAIDASRSAQRTGR